MTKTDRQGVLMDWLVSCYSPFSQNRLHLEPLDALDALDGSGNQFWGRKAREASHSQVERPKGFREPAFRRPADQDCHKASQKRLNG